MARTERGTAEYAALADALAETRAPCQGDWRFVLDRNDIDNGDLAIMRGICRRCPLTDLCSAYATAARPTAGMWAGRYYRPRKATNPMEPS